MKNEEEIGRVIVDSLHVDDEGFKQVKSFSISEVMELGIDDVPAFLDGMLDGENDNDVESFNVDYIKGYKYAKTGKF